MRPYQTIVLSLAILAAILLICGEPIKADDDDDSSECSLERRPSKIVCYFTSWSNERENPWKYKVDNIPENSCTHILYAFAGIDESTYEINSLGPASGESSIEDFMRLRDLSPQSKLMLSVGGWNEGGKKYSEMVSSASTRRAFIDSVVIMLGNYGFDGFDLDWEYPGDLERLGQASDKENYLKLVQELREAFDVNLSSDIEITAAVPITQERLDTGYDVKELCKVLDAIHLMAYDLRGSWDKNVDVHTPLFARPFDIESGYEDVNVNDGGELWNLEGCPRHKIVIGTAFYGRTFTLANSDEHGLYAPVNTDNPAGNAGRYTDEAGFMAYFEILEKLKGTSEEAPWTQEWDEVGKVPYAYSGDQWVGFENPRSLTIKMNHIKSRGYAGAMFWALDYDDYRGVYNKTTPNVLLETVVSGMTDYKVPIDFTEEGNDDDGDGDDGEDDDGDDDDGDDDEDDD